MRDNPNSIGILGKHQDPQVRESIISLARHLHARGATVLVDKQMQLEFGKNEVQRVAEADLAARVELVIAIGGDGTMLYAARLVAHSGVPLLGINRGRLGFLADVTPADMLDRVDDVLAGAYTAENRLVLEAEVIRDGQSVASSIGLNDIVIQKWETGRMLEFDTWINGVYVNTHGGDGLIIATATGSTAYALSGGGPIIHPELDAVVLVPICPHTLSDRPIVVRADCELEVRILDRPETKAQVTCDGRLLDELASRDVLKVRPADHRITLIHPPGHDYYRILRSKLHWGRGSRSNSVKPDDTD